MTLLKPAIQTGGQNTVDFISGSAKNMNRVRRTHASERGDAPIEETRALYLRLVGQS